MMQIWAFRLSSGYMAYKYTNGYNRATFVSIARWRRKFSIGVVKTYFLFYFLRIDKGPAAVKIELKIPFYQIFGNNTGMLDVMSTSVWTLFQEFSRAGQISAPRADEKRKILLPIGYRQFQLKQSPLTQFAIHRDITSQGAG